jgi:hypothetical protein
MKKTLSFSQIEAAVEVLKRKMSSRDWLFLSKKPLKCLIDGREVELELTTDFDPKSKTYPVLIGKFKD